MRGNKGITLIALVITIIVLLILAGISIAMLAGNNSILNRSAQARVANALGAAKDEVNMAVMEAMESYYESIYNSNSATGTAATFTKAALDTYIKGAVTAVTTTDVSISSNPVWSASEVSGKGFSITLKYNPDSSTVTGYLSNGVMKWDGIVYAGQAQS